MTTEASQQFKGVKDILEGTKKLMETIMSYPIVSTKNALEIALKMRQPS